MTWEFFTDDDIRSARRAISSYSLATLRSLSLTSGLYVAAALAIVSRARFRQYVASSKILLVMLQSCHL
jgi:hypothetical protein